MQRLCDWVKRRSISVSYIYIYIYIYALENCSYFRNNKLHFELWLRRLRHVLLSMFHDMYFVS